MFNGFPVPEKDGGSIKRSTAKGTLTGAGQKQVRGLLFTPSIVIVYTKETTLSFENNVIFGNPDQSSTSSEGNITSISVGTAITRNLVSAACNVVYNGTAQYAADGTAVSNVQSRIVERGFDVDCYYNYPKYWVAIE